MNTTSSTAEDILACARTLIVAGGYNGFSYADIAEVVGIRKPSIHHYFPAKADLVGAVVSRYREEAETGLGHMQGQVADPVAQLRMYTDYWEACIADASLSFCVCALLAVQLPVLPPEVAGEVRAYFRLLSDWLATVLERGAQEGRLTLFAEPRVEAELFMASVHGAMLSARAYGDPKIFKTITTPLLDRLSAQP